MNKCAVKISCKMTPLGLRALEQEGRWPATTPLFHTPSVVTNGASGPGLRGRRPALRRQGRPVRGGRGTPTGSGHDPADLRAGGARPHRLFGTTRYRSPGCASRGVAGAPRHRIGRGRVVPCRPSRGNNGKPARRRGLQDDITGAGFHDPRRGPGRERSRVRARGRCRADRRTSQGPLEL